jgi:hypothetical protein
MPPRRSFLLLQKPYIQAIANVTGLDLGGKRTEVYERLSVNEPLIEALVLWVHSGSSSASEHRPTASSPPGCPVGTSRVRRYCPNCRDARYSIPEVAHLATFQPD